MGKDTQIRRPVNTRSNTQKNKTLNLVALKLFSGAAEGRKKEHANQMRLSCKAAHGVAVCCSALSLN